MGAAVAREFVKWGAFGLLGNAPVLQAKLARLRSSGALTILNLHRVAPDDRSAYRPLNPGLFEELLGFVKSNFEPVTFATANEPSKSGKPKIILSFDDGYADFAEHAAPLLRKHGVRVNHNIIPACVESGRPPLNVLMQDFVGRASYDALEALVVPGFASATLRSNRGAFGQALSAFLKARSIAEQRQLADTLLPQVEAEPGFRPTAMMTREQIAGLADEHEFGAHSFEHASLAHESNEYVRDDVDRCRQWFDRELGQAMTVYAVPNGSYRSGQIEQLKHSGIDHVLLVDEDFSSARQTVHRRFSFYANSPAEMRFRATGAFRWPS